MVDFKHDSGRCTELRRIARFPSPLTLEILARLENEHFDAVIEVTPDDDESDAIALSPLSPTPFVQFCFTTKTLYQLPVTRMLVNFLRTRIGPVALGLDAVESVLHEAISNAVLHGNLEMPAFDKATLAGLSDYVHTLNQRLAQPEYANRRILIGLDWSAHWVTFAVLDQGTGFDYPDIIEVPPSMARPSCEPRGRGLGVMNKSSDSIEFSMDGRLIRLKFYRCDNNADA